MQLFNDLTAAYEAELRNYIANPSEEGLAQAYQIGRQALGTGIGLVAFAEMHWRVFAKLADEGASRPFASNLAASFFAEGMAAYEMALRGYRDANQVLKQANEALERAGQMKTRFFNYLNHELRTPLNSVLGFADLMATRAPGPLNDVQARYCANIGSSGRHMLELVNEMLDMAKLDAGRMEVASEPLALNAIIDAVVEQLRPQATMSGIAIEFLPAAHEEVIGDRHRLIQVFLNLTTNALKFTPEGGRVEIRTGRASDRVLVSVADTGAGIPSAQLDVIFDEFAQVDFATDGSRQGSGLGLPISRRLAELMGGSLTVVSEPGRGSTFTVAMPRSGEARAVHSQANRA
ncbi:MAG TPA: HAMP domain-containing sensor histidine kinase [Candidatus Micrarchaeaceae archaeon]|nr:HAMP domain-containing sensor histidine kinase [Candidatus Micrarchaeaceae archaeon]